MYSRNYSFVLAAMLLLTSAFAAANGDVAAEIKALQAGFIQDINNSKYDKVVAAFHESYKGLDQTKGFWSLDARRGMFKTRFASGVKSVITILETDVRPLGNDYALLRSHLKKETQAFKADPAKTEDWWYTAIYIRTKDGWKVIHEQ